MVSLSEYYTRMLENHSIIFAISTVFRYNRDLEKQKNRLKKENYD